MGASYTTLLYYCEVFWLFLTKVTKSIHKLKVEITIVIKEKKIWAQTCLGMKI